MEWEGWSGRGEGRGWGIGGDGGRGMEMGGQRKI